jgi:signal transduction histidine kinase
MTTKQKTMIVTGASHKINAAVATEINTEAAVTLVQDNDDVRINHSALTLRAGVQNLDQDTLDRLTRDAEQNCPLSRVLESRHHTGREAGITIDRRMRREAADSGSSLERHNGVLPPPDRESSNSPAADLRAPSWPRLGSAEIGAVVGGLIRQGRPLPVVLTTLCQLFDATVKGYSCSVLLLDCTGAKIRSAAGSSLPASYLKQLEGRRVSWAETPLGATLNAKTPKIVLEPVTSILPEGEKAAPAAAPGLRLHEVSPILSLTGDPLGIFAVYQCERNSDVTRFDSTLISQFTYFASAAIERMRSDEALKQSAALLARTQQLSSTCCFSWRVETDEISWSKELSLLFELEPGDVPVTLELIGSRVHPEDLSSFHETIERARNGVSHFEVERRLRMPDNSVKYLRVIAHRTCDQEGQLQYIGAVQDVTHRRRTEEALAKLRAELERTARATSLGVLTAAIAHEVNQPLSGIVTNAGTCRRMLAVDPPDVEGARETTRCMMRDAERASEIVKRLRALFRNKGTTNESVDLNEATREVVAISLRELDKNKVIVRTELAGELPPVQGDRVQLQQVILNLLLNASDAMSAVDDRLRQLVIRTERDEKDRVRLSVRDTGVGIEPQTVHRLFDGFYTTKSSGMGIGLTVSRSIIDSHKGRLWATPNDGPGATFSFSIPCGPQDATAGVIGARMSERGVESQLGRS